MKRLSLSDYLLSLLFIVMLICIVGAFFYGVEVGKKRAADKYEQLLVEKQAQEHLLSAYHQQYFVSFYHTVFLPWREFHKEWFETMERIRYAEPSRQLGSMLKDLERSARQAYDSVRIATVPDTSPMLWEAQKKYMQSLKLFATALGRIDPKGMTGPELAEAIEHDAYFREAKQFALQAQNDFYDAIAIWNETVQNVPHRPLLEQSELAVDQWRNMNLNFKNRYVTAWMMENDHFVEFLPQDLVIRIDELIRTGQAEQMGLSTIPSIASTLVQTGAVRNGDFLNGQSRYYANEPVPQLPFFSANSY